MAIVSEEQVIKVLRQYNSWWRNPLDIKNESKPQKRLAYYEAFKMIKHKTLRRFAVLSGARRVGKTTIMYQMIDSLIDEGIKYIFLLLMRLFSYVMMKTLKLLVLF